MVIAALTLGIASIGLLAWAIAEPGGGSWAPKVRPVIAIPLILLMWLVFFAVAWLVK